MYLRYHWIRKHKPMKHFLDSAVTARTALYGPQSKLCSNPEYQICCKTSNHVGRHKLAPVLTEAFRGFPRPSKVIVQQNCTERRRPEGYRLSLLGGFVAFLVPPDKVIVPQIRSLTLPSISFLIHYSLILPFDAI
jgi:hypothetical protein